MSTHEVWEEVINTSYGIDYLDTAYSLTRQLDYYKNNIVATNNYALAIKKNKSGSAKNWWLRTAKSDTNYYFNYVGGSGGFGYYDSCSNYGVAPAFRF